MNKFESIYYDAQGRPYLALSLPQPEIYYKDTIMHKKDADTELLRGVVIIDMFDDE